MAGVHGAGLSVWMEVLYKEQLRYIDFSAQSETLGDCVKILIFAS